MFFVNIFNTKLQLKTILVVFSSDCIIFDEYKIIFAVNLDKEPFVHVKNS